MLGAVHIELGDLQAGREWYAKAESLGASRQTIDNDLRGLLMRSPVEEQQRIREYLLGHDPERFAWLRRWPSTGQSPSHPKSAHSIKRRNDTAFVEAGQHDHRTR